MKGKISLVITGRMGTGKTTAITGSIKYVDPKLTIRTVETTFEMYLRELYPNRNIFAVSETPFITMEDLQDALKKSDGQVIIIGEVATNSAAARHIQAGQVGSALVLCSHHATTAEGLINSFRNSLMAEGHYSNELIAEDQVLEVIKLDCHLATAGDGRRFVERYTEIIPKTRSVDFPEFDPLNAEESMNRVRREYMYRQTVRSSFDTSDIMHFNIRTNTYEPREWFSAEMTERILMSITDKDFCRLKAFVSKYWGPNYV